MSPDKLSSSCSNELTIVEVADNPLYVNIVDASAADIEDLVIETKCIDLLLNELNKAKNIAPSPLLQLLTTAWSFQ